MKGTYPLKLERKLRDRRIKKDANKLHDSLKDFDTLYTQNYDACLYSYCRDKANLKQRELRLNFLTGTILAFILQAVLSFLVSLVLQMTATSQSQLESVGCATELFNMLCFFGVSMLIILLIIYFIALFFYKEDLINFELKTKRLEQLPKEDV